MSRFIEIKVLDKKTESVYPQFPNTNIIIKEISEDTTVPIELFDGVLSFRTFNTGENEEKEDIEYETPNIFLGYRISTENAISSQIVVKSIKSFCSHFAAQYGGILCPMYEGDVTLSEYIRKLNREGLATGPNLNITGIPGEYITNITWESDNYEAQQIQKKNENSEKKPSRLKSLFKRLKKTPTKA